MPPSLRAAEEEAEDNAPRVLVDGVRVPFPLSTPASKLGALGEGIAIHFRGLQVPACMLADPHRVYARASEKKLEREDRERRETRP